MRILYTHLDDSPPSCLGGGARGMVELISGMKKHFHEQVMAIVNPGPLAEALARAEVPVAEISSSKWRTPETLGVFRKVVSELRPDLVHSHHRYTTFLWDLFFKNQVFILHTERILHQSKRMFFRTGHFVTTVSEGVRQNLIRSYRVPENRVRTITNAVDFRSPDPGQVEILKRQYPRREGESWALCSGRLEKQKGHLYLIEAISLLPPTHQKRIRIFLAGDGSLAGSLKDLAAKKDVADSFVFLGTSTLIPELLSLVDFLILPSLWEGLARSAIEALKSGKAVIATNIPGMGEVVRHEQNGLLVPVRDSLKLALAIQRLMDHPDQIRRMGEEAARLSENFSFERMMGSYHELYQKLLESRRDGI